MRVNDIDLHYEERGEGPPLLLLHGFTGAGADWAHVFDLDGLARAWRVIVPDLRGHGATTATRWPLTHREVALDVLALADALGVERFAAIGLSFGGNALLHAATMAPERVEAMVVVSATPRFPDEARAVMRAMPEAPASDEERRVLEARHRGGEAQIRALYQQARAFADSYDDLRFDATSLGAIRARTLVVQGDRDPLYPIGLSLELYAAIPRAALWVIPESGHAPIFGAWREAFARAAIDFLAARHA